MTETGSIDDLAGLADVAEEHGIHFHVDAACGGPALFTNTLRKKMAGIERADSVTIDGHKQLFVHMWLGSGRLRVYRQSARMCSNTRRSFPRPKPHHESTTPNHTTPRHVTPHTTHHTPHHTITHAQPNVVLHVSFPIKRWNL